MATTNGSASKKKSGCLVPLVVVLVVLVGLARWLAGPRVSDGTGSTTSGAPELEAGAASSDASSADAKAEEAQRKVEEKKRLAARQFISMQPIALAQQLGARNDPDELWGTQYRGKFVRWTAKYERKGHIVEFVASTGDFTSLSCKDFDPAHDPARFDDVQQWSRISVEGRLAAFQRQMGKDKVEFILTECIARKL
jgi:hypothetical protein